LLEYICLFTTELHRMICDLYVLILSNASTVLTMVLLVYIEVSYKVKQ